ncbi:hypothetical protein Golob_026260 [Gossypium lobatum]|uniref:DUF4283 domain-containing protein n=1 Tax=Gossypium lobatum TaxID=34289 RepID=A0A7J8LUU3_9ROSI|nr:hypothetical protein [Gossypium lobatum]
MERRKMKLIMSPFWIKVGPCPLEYDKDLMNAVGSTFGGVLHRSWFELKECTEVSNVIKHLLEDDLPYSVALKVEFKLVRKVSQKLGANLKKSMKQFAYVGEDDDSTHSKCQSVGIRTPLMAAMDDTTWKEGARFGNEAHEIREDDRGKYWTLIDSPLEKDSGWELIDHDGPHLGSGPINDSNGAQECSRVLTHGKRKEECEFFSEVAFPSYDTTGSKKVKGAREEVNNFMMDNSDKNALEQALALTNE